MLLSEGQELQELGVRTALEVDECSDPRRPTKATVHTMSAREWGLTGGGRRERVPGGF